MEYICKIDSKLKSELLKKLAKDPVSYRHIYGTIDPEYQHFGPGKPLYDIYSINGLPLLMEIEDRVCFLWETPSEDAITSLCDFLPGASVNDLWVVGDECFCALRPRLTDGQWRCSRNYSVDASAFKPKPLPVIRRLSQEDRAKLELTVKNGVLETSASTMRDFNLMADGMPVICYGAFDGDEIAGFCSANPICRGVQEISWIVVAPDSRRKGFASALLTAQAAEAFANGEALAYYAGSAGDDLHAMLLGLGFHEVKPTYRFIPATSEEQWRLVWGKVV